ncbi:hypothetical protein EYR41_002385 [Orbilia oligospora]|uniref:Uncharacterized protein n=1 Tax=Orbilia oligospora TaxID=2813651 RepID=A0A7C8NX92_ORBOL|nr:hypothetical protein TWF751_012066 [Orbilia oligospora]TGJ62405.1 hypothetical protein EYR41_002385 [Orbilia oligospora]
MLSFRSPIAHRDEEPSRESTTRSRVHLNISEKWRDLVVANWHLGFTAFGGPPVHFQIFHTRFVDRLKWIDEQMYQELFALCQALPGPASTKMLFCINSIHGGFLGGFLAFCIWSLPGAIGMYGLSLGVSKIGDKMPSPVYALLSGLNAATVGIIALAAVQLSEKAITDKITRILVFLGGAIGMLYSALWFFPVLMFAGGVATVVWDYRWLQNFFKKFKKQKIENQEESLEGVTSEAPIAQVDTASIASTTTRQRRRDHQHQDQTAILPVSTLPSSPTTTVTTPLETTEEKQLLTWRTGTLVILAFFTTFIAVMVLRGTLKAPPLPYSVFANLYLAGTIIFGGGPVVIPLLRDYIVGEGWVSSRDFLLGLAIIQAFPGPNFNFAVYLGSLAVRSSSGRNSIPKELGAIIGFLGIFTPGIILAAGVMGLWSTIRKKRWTISFLRGVNALATGLVYTAVYRLFQTAVLDEEYSGGRELGIDPFWVAVTATSFVGGRWFGVEPFFAILLGGGLGVVWWGVVKA